MTGWDEASAPGQIGQKLERLVTGRPPPDRWARHHDEPRALGHGHRLGRPVRRAGRQDVPAPWLRALALGPAVWLAGYVVLPLAGVYKPIWEYDARTLGEDLSAHLVFGVTTSAVFAALTQERP